MLRVIVALGLALLCAPALAANSIITSQIANAQGWAQGQSYQANERVVAGAGYTATGTKDGGTFNSGSALYLWSTALGGTSSGSGQGPTISGSCGNSTAIVDGTVTWRCLSLVDYSAATDYLIDDAAWAGLASYVFHSFVFNGGNIYWMTDGAKTQASPCTSAGSGGPTGTGSAISDGTCTWAFIKTIRYSSRTSFIPHQKYTTGNSGGQPTIQMVDYYVGNVWYGGPTRAEYLTGSNGEGAVIPFFAHSDFTNDLVGSETFPLCHNGVSWGRCGGTGVNGTTASSTGYTIALQAAAGDSFRDNATAATNALNYDSTKGVAFRSTSAFANCGSSPLVTNSNFSQICNSDVFAVVDSSVTFLGVQVKADHGTGIDGRTHGNQIMVQNSIVDSNQSTSVVGSSGKPNEGLYLDATGVVINTLVINRSSTTGAAGIFMAYRGYLDDVTVINLGSGTDSTCLVTNSDTTSNGFPTRTWKNVACFGFAHQESFGNAEQGSLAVSNNATDGANPDPNAGGTFTSASNGAVNTIATFEGVGNTCGAGHAASCYSLTFANQFVDTSTDFRIKPGADIIRAGLSIAGATLLWNDGLSSSTVPGNVVDIVAEARPNGTGFSIGAMEYYPYSNIHNAPGWVHSQNYTVPNVGFPPLRVNNGAGWNEGAGTYNPGSLLRSYQLVGGAGATCTSAASGGPSGTGSSISDGTCTWKYISGTDYITITGFGNDAPTCTTLFAAGVVYFHDYCTSDSPLRAYWNIDSTTSSGETCSIPPTGIGSPIAPGDGCTWGYVAPVTYSSQTSYIPVQRFLNGTSGSPPTVKMSGFYTGLVWNDAEYDVGGTEQQAIRQALTFQAHQDFTNDLTCSEWSGGPVGISLNNGIVLKAAPGEGFLDYPGGAPTLGGVNQKYGVAIVNSKAGGVSDSNGGVLAIDNELYLQGLQIKSANSAAMRGNCQHNNVEFVSHTIAESDANANVFALECDGGCSFYNDLILSAGAGGIGHVFPAYVTFSTIICTQPFANNSGIARESASGGVSILNNVAIFGCAHAIAIPSGSTTGTIFSAGTDRNATDVANPDPGVGTPVATGSIMSPDPLAATLPGAHSQFALSAGAQFVNSTSDWKLKTGSTLIGAGASVGTITITGGLPGTVTYDPDTPDILGQIRPGASGYDIGAEESMGPLILILGGGRILLR